MALTACPECNGQVSDKAIACPACGYPIAPARGKSTWPAMLGGVAGSYISAQAVVMVIVGTVFTLALAAVLIALILKG